MKRLSRILSFPAPTGRVAAYEREFYVRASGVEKVRFRMIEDGDDAYTMGEYAFSSNNGVTWSDEKSYPMRRTLSGRYIQEYPTHVFLETTADVLIQPYVVSDLHVFDEGQHLVNHSEAFQNTYLGYRCSHDGGRTWFPAQRLRQSGCAFSDQHPFDSIWLGRNGMAENAQNGIILLSNGRLLAAFAISDIDADGLPYNPTAAYSWQAVILLEGTLQDRRHLQMTEVGVIRIDPAQSTRGLTEPTLVEFPDGTVLMVMRGSNGGPTDPNYSIPSYKWYTLSNDFGNTWSALRPWTYADGSELYSPSSISVLVRHSSGDIYWFGNISKTNARGNSPRSSLICLKVDRQSYRPLAQKIVVVDEAQPSDGAHLSLSNFSVQEDRLTGHFIVNMTRWNWKDNAPTGDAFRYIVSVKETP